MIENQAIEIFKEYLFDNFDMNDKNILLKYNHSLRVMELSKLIAKDNYFNEYDELLVTIGGLLHDYGRFEQLTKYNTYDDIKSIDHGQLGSDKLFRNNEISKFNLDNNMYESLDNIIKYHNKCSIDLIISEHDKKMCQVIRDADKIDIYYLLSINNILLMNEDEKISSKVLDTFYTNKQIESIDVKNRCDRIILFLAMMFDINYLCSYKYIRDNDYINKIFNNLDNNKKYQKYFDYVNKYIDKRMDNVNEK